MFNIKESNIKISLDPDAFTQIIQCVHFENIPFSHFAIISKA